jgi:alkane 1-monooxygenase
MEADSKIQKKLNKLENRSIYSLKNDMLWFTLIQIGYLFSIYTYFGTNAFVVVFVAGIIGFLLLETINYI